MGSFELIPTDPSLLAHTSKYTILRLVKVEHSTTFYESTVVENADFIKAEDSLQSMGNAEQGSVVERRSKGSLNVSFS